MQEEAFLLDGDAHLRLHGGALHYGRLHGGIEEANRISAGRLGLIHGEIRPLQQLLDRIGLVQEQGDADAGRTVDLLFIQPIDGAQGGPDLFRD